MIWYACGEGESSDATNDRTKLASRGGLLYMKATRSTYVVFHAVELVVRSTGVWLNEYEFYYMA